MQKIKRNFRHSVIWLGLKLHGAPKGATAALSRNHVIEVNPKSGLISLMGGKWTSFRHMAEETVNELIKCNPKLQVASEKT